MAYNGLSTETKISELSTSYGNLQEKDIFIFSHFLSSDNGTDKYDYTRKIQYDTLSSNMMSCLLSDDAFFQGMYSMMSSRILNDQTFLSSLASALSGYMSGRITYNSYYPQN